MALPLPGTPIIIDIGSAYAKVGFAGEPGPRFTFPCITGTEKYKSVMVDVSARSVYIGDDAMKMRGVLKVKYPVQRGNIMDWNEYYEILNHIFYTLLRIENLSNYPIIYIEHPFIPTETREFIAKVLFETHRVKSLIMLQSPFLSLFSIGLTTGLVVESGDGITWIVPIINGQILNQAVQKLNLAGIDVNHNLKSLLMREGINIESAAIDEILREIKEKGCYYVLDWPPKTSDNYSYPMPDGTVKQIPNRVLHEAPEVMFQPAMLGYNMMNIPQAIIYSLQSTNKEYWGDLLSHVVLSGGNCTYPGFEMRLKQEINALLSELGPISKAKKIKPLFEKVGDKQKLEAFETSKKALDTCSECGTLVDLTTGVDKCPSCGAPLKRIEIAIDLGSSKDKEKSDVKTTCPYCKKELKDKSSIYCPYCGKSMQQTKAPKLTEELLEKTNDGKEFAEFETSDDDIIKFFIPENLQHAMFNGAAILGSLPSFQHFFITYEEFQANPNVLNRDITDVFR